MADTFECVGCGGRERVFVEVGEQDGFAGALSAGDRLSDASGTDDDQYVVVVMRFLSEW